MATYSEMRSRIADELANDGAVTTDQIKYAIQDTIKLYERREWWFNQNISSFGSYSSTFNTVANQEYYTATDWSPLTDAVQIDAMTITYNGVISPVMPVNFESIDEEQTGYAVSVPRVYAYFNQAIRFYPIPNGAYPITVSYAMRYAALVNDTDANPWTTEAEELIRQGAKRRIALNYFHAEDVAQRCAVLEKEALDALLAENRRRMPNTTLRSPAITYQKRFNIITG